MWDLSVGRKKKTLSVKKITRQTIISENIRVRLRRTSLRRLYLVLLGMIGEKINIKTAGCLSCFFFFESISVACI